MTCTFVCMQIHIHCVHVYCSSSGLTVTIDVDYNAPSDFVGGPNDYRAASTVTLTCRVQEATGVETYLWTSTCTGPLTHCYVPGRTSHTITRTTLRSTDSGMHTCTATNPITRWTGSATIEMNVVGMCAWHSMRVLFSMAVVIKFLNRRMD